MATFLPVFLMLFALGLLRTDETATIIMAVSAAQSTTQTRSLLNSQKETNTATKTFRFENNVPITTSTRSHSMLKTATQSVKPNRTLSVTLTPRPTPTLTGVAPATETLNESGSETFSRTPPPTRTHTTTRNHHSSFSITDTEKNMSATETNPFSFSFSSSLVVPFVWPPVPSDAPPIVVIASLGAALSLYTFVPTSFNPMGVFHLQGLIVASQTGCVAPRTRQAFILARNLIAPLEAVFTRYSTKKERKNEEEEEMRRQLWFQEQQRILQEERDRYRNDEGAAVATAGEGDEKKQPTRARSKEEDDATLLLMLEHARTPLFSSWLLLASCMALFVAVATLHLLLSEILHNILFQKLSQTLSQPSMTEAKIEEMERIHFERGRGSLRSQARAAVLLPAFSIMVGFALLPGIVYFSWGQVYGPAAAPEVSSTSSSSTTTSSNTTASKSTSGHLLSTSTSSSYQADITAERTISGTLLGSTTLLALIGLLAFASTVKNKGKADPQEPKEELHPPKERSGTHGSSGDVQQQQQPMNKLKQFIASSVSFQFQGVWLQYQHFLYKPPVSSSSLVKMRTTTTSLPNQKKTKKKKNEAEDEQEVKEKDEKDVHGEEGGKASPTTATATNPNHSPSKKKKLKPFSSSSLSWFHRCFAPAGFYIPSEYFHQFSPLFTLAKRSAFVRQALVGPAGWLFCFAAIAALPKALFEMDVITTGSSSSSGGQSISSSGTSNHHCWLQYTLLILCSAVYAIAMVGYLRPFRSPLSTLHVAFDQIVIILFCISQLVTSVLENTTFTSSSSVLVEDLHMLRTVAIYIAIGSFILQAAVWFMVSTIIEPCFWRRKEVQFRSKSSHETPTTPSGSTAAAASMFNLYLATSEENIAIEEEAREQQHRHRIEAAGTLAAEKYFSALRTTSSRNKGDIEENGNISRNASKTVCRPRVLVAEEEQYHPLLAVPLLPRRKQQPRHHRSRSQRQGRESVTEMRCSSCSTDTHSTDHQHAHEDSTTIVDIENGKHNQKEVVEETNNEETTNKPQQQQLLRWYSDSAAMQLGGPSGFGAPGLYWGELGACIANKKNSRR